MVKVIRFKLFTNQGSIFIQQRNRAKSINFVQLMRQNLEANSKLVFDLRCCEKVHY